MPNLSVSPKILEAALNSMGEAVLILGRDGHILYFSTRAEELTGMNASEVIGHSFVEIFQGSLCDINEYAAHSGISDHEDYNFLLPDGRSLAIHRTIRPILGTQNEPLGTVVTFHIPTSLPARCKMQAPTQTGKGSSLDPFIGRSAAVRKIVDTIRRVAASEATILILGESGTGKELVARSIHEASRRRTRSLIAVNCAAIPQDLLESELFGHVRGAFSGATRDRRGSVEVAQGGTLFLDEIGDLPMSMQAKLLRLLQERTYQRVGDSTPKSADVRILAATNVDLDQAIAQGRFRQDLYFRLCVIPIHIPPLRSRREDIAPLAAFLLARRSVASGRLPMHFSPAAMRLLEEARWEGNVRQLINTIDYAIALCESSIVDPRNLPEDLHSPKNWAPEERRTRYQSDGRGDNEASLILNTLIAHGYHRQRTAEALGMDRATLYRKMRDYRIIIPRGDEKIETG